MHQIVGLYDDQPAQEGQAKQGVGGNDVRIMRVMGACTRKHLCLLTFSGSQLVLRQTLMLTATLALPVAGILRGCLQLDAPAHHNRLLCFLPDGEMRPPPPSAARWATEARPTEQLL